MRETLFPKEVTGNVPRITLTGRETLHVEQHHGVAVYTPEEILLRTSSGMLRILGTTLSFRTYAAGEAVIDGQIISLAYLSERGAI